MSIMLSKIGTYLGIVGALLVALGKPLEANMIWVISNPVLIHHNRKIKEFNQSKMFVVFTLISVFGVYNLWGT